MLDLEVLLKRSPSDPPAGPNLQYTADFAGLERAAQGKPQRQVGSAVVAAEPPEWRSILEKGSAVLAASKDLRVAILVVRAATELYGFAGLASGLGLLRGLVEQYWDGLHPLLDVDDGNDPTARISALAALTHREMILTLRATPLVVSRALGPVTLRALEAAARPAEAKPGPPPAAAPPTAATLEAIFQEVPVETLTEAVRVLTLCSKEGRALSDAWSARLPGSGPDFSEFLRVLGQAEQAVKTRLASRQANGEGRDAPADPLTTTALSTSPTPAPRGFVCEVRSRDDVVQALDAICAYYTRAEPSSPLPVMLQRCRRLVTMNFTDILKELLPDSIANLQKIAGKLDG
ncbi:MAG: type VI secretion system protein TssA [Polyangiaceae bacterium]|nr:type VI secretion system protein TssA [Polyangiaceae bacterium]